MKTKVLEAAGVRVTVEVPDGVPFDVVDAITADVTIPADGSEEDGRFVFDALGGPEAFELIDPGNYRSGMALVFPKGATFGQPLSLLVRLPTGRERPVEPAPFLAELRGEQDGPVVGHAS